ncbi:MAG TPA: outer membrane lipoprotein carrier protein LolA [Polyangiaceae bacterium]
MRLGRRAVLTGAAGALLVSRAARADDPVDALFARVARARASMRTLQGPFTQVRTIGLLSTDVKSTGTLALVRPDRLRWELAPPDAVVFWMVPEGLAYRSAQGTGRVPSATPRIAAMLDDLRTLLGGDLSHLRSRWDVRVSRDDATGAELAATARTPDAPLKSFTFALAPDLVRPVRALLVEGPHDRTAIDFGALQLNAPVDDAQMRAP